MTKTKLTFTVTVESDTAAVPDDNELALFCDIFQRHADSELNDFGGTWKVLPVNVYVNTAPPTTQGAGVADADSIIIDSSDTAHLFAALKEWDDAVREYMNTPGNGCGGNLHVILDDGNVNKAHIDVCRQACEKRGDWLGLKLLEHFEIWNETERVAMLGRSRILFRLDSEPGTVLAGDCSDDSAVEIALGNTRLGGQLRPAMFVAHDDAGAVVDLLTAKARDYHGLTLTLTRKTQ